VVPDAVAVLDGSGEDVRDRLDAAVRMPREAGEVVFGDVVAEVVEEQERVEVGRVAEAERAAQMHSRAFDGRLGLDEPFDRSQRHETGLLFRRAGILAPAGNRRPESRGYRRAARFFPAADIACFAARVILPMNSARRKRTADQSSSIATMRTHSKPAAPRAPQPVSRLNSHV